MGSGLPKHKPGPELRAGPGLGLVGLGPGLGLQKTAKRLTFTDKICYIEVQAKYEHPATRSDRISEASRLYSWIALVCILMHLHQLRELI